MTVKKKKEKNVLKKMTKYVNIKDALKFVGRIITGIY